MGQIERTYNALNLPSFAQTRPAIESYVRSLDGYRKNEFPDLPEETRRNITREWRDCFERWGYPA